MLLPEWLPLSGYGVFLGWLSSSLPDGIPLEKNSDKQPPKGQAKQKVVKKSPKEELAPSPKSWGLAAPRPHYLAFQGTYAAPITLCPDSVLGRTTIPSWDTKPIVWSGQGSSGQAHASSAQGCWECRGCVRCPRLMGI